MLLSHCANSRTLPSRADRVDVPASGRLACQRRNSAVSMCGAFLIGEPGEAAEQPLVGAKIITKAASDAQIVVELGRDAHCTPPATGQGCEMDRSPSISSRTYTIVDARERCRSTSPTSSIDAPAFTSRVARL